MSSYHMLSLVIKKFMHIILLNPRKLHDIDINFILILYTKKLKILMLTCCI